MIKGEPESPCIEELKNILLSRNGHGIRNFLSCSFIYWKVIRLAETQPRYGIVLISKKIIEWI